MQEPLRFQPFRGHIDNLIPPLACIGQCLGNLVLRKGAIDIGSVDACLVEGLHLVFHERDQGRDHQCDTGQQKRRHLIADGFPCTGGHNTQHILSCQNMVYQCFLSFPKRMITIVLL